jgi:hypothetical protein
MFTDVKRVQFLNISELMVLRVDGWNTTVDKFVQSINTLVPIVTTEDGRVMEPNRIHPWNA